MLDNTYSLMTSMLAAGKEAIRRGDMGAALTELERVTQKFPDEAIGHMALGSMLLAVGRAREALPSLRQAAKLVPQDASVQKKLGEALLQVNERMEMMTKCPSPQSSALVLGGVNIEITTFCNLQCAGCSRSVMNNHGQWENRHMKVGDFKGIVEALPPAGTLMPFGIGEPTFHPDLPEMIRIAYSTRKFNTIALTTNALLHDTDYYRTLFNAGLSNVTISVDSLDSILANRLRMGTDVNRLKERIRVLANDFNGKVETRTVVGRENVATIPALLQELNSVGPLKVNLQPYDDLGNPDGCLTVEENAWFANRIPAIAEPFHNLQVVPSHFIRSGEVCVKPWREPYITVDGYVTPCCRVTDPNICNFGNALSTPYSEVWLGPEVKQWRQEFLSESAPFCVGCPMVIPRRSPSSEDGFRISSSNHM